MRIAKIGMMFWCAVLLAGCVVLQPKPDGTVGVSLFPPSSSQATSGANSNAGGGSKSSGAAHSSGPARPGTALTSGVWWVLVQSTETPMTLPNGARPHGGKRFLVVDVAIQNVGASGALAVRADQFRLFDVHGTTVAPYTTILAGFNAQNIKPIDPGAEGFTKFVYDVDANSVYGFAANPTRSASTPMAWTVP